jgi:dTDP-4-dehydrorhamnose reductase
MSWLITGGSGQLGIALSQELGERGILFDALGFQDLDVTNGPNVKSIITKLLPNIVVNCAAWTDVDGAESNELQASKVNCYGAGNVAIAAKMCSARLIHISTDYVFSGLKTTPWEADDEISAQCAYGRTKAH